MPRMKQISIDVDVNRAIEASRTSFSEVENDILRRMLLATPAPTRNEIPVPTMQLRDSRRRGEWSVLIDGKEFPAANMKDAYCTLLRLLAERDPQFLSKFSDLRSRTRRFVARDGVSLYQSSPHLAKDHATVLVEGWFVDTNLSTPQVGQRARAAAETVGLKYGPQLRIAEAGQTI